MQSATEATPITAEMISQLLPGEVYDALGTGQNGLTSEEAQARLRALGANELVTRTRWRSWFGLLAVAIRPLLLPLWVAALLAYTIAETATATMLAVVAALNTIAGAVQERKAERATAALRTALPGYAHVVRDGRDYHILAAQVVPGDVLLLHAGELVPADARVVDEHDLRAVNVALMGETSASRVVAASVGGEDLLVTQLPNVVYAGSRIASGTGHAVVFATGTATAYGRIASLTETAHEDPSPLLWVFARLGGVVMLLAALVSIAGGVYVSNSGLLARRDMLLLVVTLLTAAVPAGLMPGITVALVEGARRLARHGARVRRLSSVETLGATTVICADKTGTLTQNEMTVRDLWTADGSISVTGVGYTPNGTFTAGGKALDAEVVKRRLEPLIDAVVLTSSARLLPPDTLRPHWHILGDPVEAAALVLAAKAGYHPSDIYAALPEVAMLQPSDNLPLEGRIVEDRGRVVAYLTGRPIVLLSRCTTIMTAGGERPLTEHDRQLVKRTIRDYDRSAMRAVAFARRRLPADAAHDVPQTDQIAHDLVFLGMIGVLDPPRQEVEDAIRACHRSGIRTMMLTGDYTVSAESIARRCALVENSRATVITGLELSAMDDATLRERLRVGDIVFARMTPEHKVRVVETLDAMGEVVLVTGGEANDVPALKAADIGVSMGSASSPAAREAADVVLQEDNFATLATAIREGRAVEQRARRLVALNLGASLVKLAAFLVTFLLGWPLFLTVGQLLLIDLLAGFMPAIAIGGTPADPKLMARQPRRSGKPLIDLRVYRLGYGWFGVLSLIGALSAAALMMRATKFGLGGSSGAASGLLSHGAPDAGALQVATAYIAVAIAVLIGVGLRLRSATWHDPFSRALLVIVVVAVASTLVAFMRVRPLHSFAALSAPPTWLWLLAIAWMLLGGVFEWGRQKVDQLPK